MTVTRPYGTLHIHAKRQIWNNLIDVYLSVVRDDEKYLYVAQPIAFEKTNDGEIYGPALSLDAREAQRLMDELWQAGLRPSEETGSAGSLAATERHLADMRALVFGGPVCAHKQREET